VALEQFKTQVLILHSQQNMLDSLSRGFSDRYAVHCATSGAEALSTLGTTQIDVLVSAQNLPGMSGLDALREAKKRSPGTIGILLAGPDADDGLEALVGDKVVFEIVRGDVTPQRLFRLVEDATRQVRLLALAESANDTTASPDEPMGEHIIMETAENGSMIISDGTGALPALKPEKIQISPNARGAEVDVLVLTRDEEFLGTVKESSRGLHNVHHATTAVQANDLARKESVGVLVTDAAMIGSNIEEITDQLRAHAPRLVAIVAGRRDDGDLLMDLINRGHVYRFLLKPVSPGRARLAIEASVKHHLDAPETAFKGKPRTAASPPPKPAPPPVKKPEPLVARRPEPPVAKRPDPAPAARPAAAPARVETPKPAGSSRPAPKVDATKAAARKNPPPAARKVQAIRPPRQAATSSPQKPAGGASRPPVAAAVRPRPDAPAARREPHISTPPPAMPRAGSAKPAKPPSPTTNGLDGAFDEGSRLTETVAGLATSFGKSLGGAATTMSGGARSVARAGTTIVRGVSAILRRPALLAGAGLIVLLAAAGVWLFSGDDAPVVPQAGEEPALAGTPTFDESDVPAPTPAPAEPAQQPLTAPLYDDLMDKAREARDDGDIYSPAGRNAMEFYIAARAASPGNPDVTAELAALTEEVFSLAETALLENRYTDASRALRVIELADPENPRLRFLSTQLAQVEFRGRLDEARAAVREMRFEDAGRILREAETMAGVDSQELDLVTEELAAARSAQRLDEVLTLAGRAADQGRLTSPSNDNARYYFELALTLDRGNAAARQGLVAIASKLVLNALGAIDAGDFAAADSLLAEARTLDPSSQELAAATASLQSARDQQASAESQRESAREALPETGAAATQAPAAGPAVPESPSAVPDDSLAGDADSDGSAASQASSAPIEQAQPANLEPVTQNPVVAIGTLKRTHYVPPKYPRSAQRRNVEGWVDLLFTVSPGGQVSEIEVVDADPATTFNDAAVEAVEQWQFEPVVENGVPVSKRVAIRMSFALQ